MPSRNKAVIVTGSVRLDISGSGMGGKVTATSWAPPAGITADEIVQVAEKLHLLGQSSQWWLGDLWNSLERGQAQALVQRSDWRGPSYDAWKRMGWVARKFEMCRRQTQLTFEHHLQLAQLEAEKADRLLSAAINEGTAGGMPTARELRQRAKAETRNERERELAPATERASRRAGQQVYSVILADPPWQFTPWSKATGMDRSPENHYPTMPTDMICKIEVPAAATCALFLWALPHMLPDALRVIEAWDFRYITNCDWVKPNPGLGYWFRNAHEHMLLATRGKMPAPAMGTQPMSWIRAPRGRHSAKPPVFHKIIEDWFPTQRRLEMFARDKRKGWDHWGNETTATEELF